MKNETSNTQQLTDWVINKIKTEYPNDVALLVSVEGASVNGDGHGEAFDYFVPATERGNELAQTFIIGGVGNDLYPRSWERCERNAALDGRYPLCLGKAKILYSRTREDEKRFESIRQKLFDNLANPEFTYKKALENLDVAMGLYRTMMFDERLYKARGLAGFIFRYLSDAVAYINGTYIDTYHNGIINVVVKWEKLPERFAEYFYAIVSASTAGELRSLSHLLIVSVRQLIARHKPQNPDNTKMPDYKWLADWYQEIRNWWNRMYFYCDTKNTVAAFDEACQLQSELDIISEEFGLEEMDLLGCFDALDLGPLSRRAAELEKIIISTIEGQGITIRRYDTLEEFLAAEK